MSDLIRFIKNVSTVPEKQIDLIQQMLSIYSYRAGDCFVREGQYPQTLGFVKKGLFRYYYVSDSGIEFTKGFFAENTILNSYSAILQKRSSYFTIEALEDSEIESIPFLEFSQLFSTEHWWKDLLIAQLQKAYIVKEKRERKFLLFDAEHRYQSFFLDYPGLESRISQQLIASYLGIAPESLSRLRRKIRALT